MRFMYLAGYQFIKAGVILVDLQSASVHQRELVLDDPNEAPATRDRTRLMTAMDVINTRFGNGTIHSGGTGKPGVNRVWTMKQERRTPAYTTSLADVPVARA
jgi:DNA polymerase V